MSRPTKSRDYRIQRMVLAIFLFSEVFAGPIRFELQKLGEQELIYLPKALLIISLGAIPLVRRRLRIEFWTIGLLILVYTAIGFLQLRSPLQALFGLWILAPFLFGMLAGPTLLEKPEDLHVILTLLFLASLMGVALNLVYSFITKLIVKIFICF